MLSANNIELPMDKIAEFCQHWQITELALFGSVLRDDFCQHSDIDFLVEFYPEAHPTLFTLVDMQDELRAIFGRDVDLVTRGGVENSRNPWRRREILSSAVVIYDAGYSISV